MAIHSLSVDVYCKSAYDPEPTYRVYVDQDLITERTWIWNRHETYIQEHLEADLEPGTHTIRVESVGEFAGFQVVNLTVDGVTQTTQDLSFAV